MLGNPEEKVTGLNDWGPPGEGGQIHEWELPKALNLEESREHHTWNNLEQVQHCANLPLQVTSPAHTKQEKMGAGLRHILPFIRR